MQSQPHILVVDDDREIRTLLQRYLDSQGFRVTAAADRRECEQRLGAGQFDLIVLDVMLPDGSGLDICRGLRDRKPHTPIILLTALKEDVDRIIGLELGADDYLGKPFNPRELIARIRAVLRRSAPEEAPASPRARTYRFAGYRLEPDTRKVTDAQGVAVDLTGAEFDLLQVFLDRPGRL
ncbi:MAG: response regulator, partial [Mesorhizobium sp.]